MALLEVEHAVRDEAVVVVAAGEIDSSTVSSLTTHLDAALGAAGDHPDRMLVVELAGVTYFGSAGLNAVLGCHERGRTAGVSVRVVADQPEVIRPIEVTKLDAVLRPYRTLEEALGSATGSSTGPPADPST